MACGQWPILLETDCLLDTCERAVTISALSKHDENDQEFAECLS